MRFLPVLLFVSACSYKIQGPTPVVTGARNERDQSTGPAYLCNAQGDAASGWLVDALGDKFAPLPTGALVHTPGVTMPTVALSGPEPYTVPAAYVHFIDQTRMPLAMRTADSAADAHTLLPGDYSLTVTNLNGASGSSAAAIRVVPPPQITAVSLTGNNGTGTVLCADQPQTLTITGTGFRGDKLPSVAIGAHTFTADASTGTTATVTLPKDTFASAETSAAGTVYTVQLTNPEGCAAPYGTAPKAPAQITAYPSCSVLGTLSVSPRFGYQFRDTPVTITNNFTPPASQGFSGALPKVTILAPLVGGGTAAQSIPLRSVADSDARTVTAVVPVCSGTSFGAPSGANTTDCPGIAPGGPYDILVIDPVSGQGKIVGAFTVVSNPPPLVTNLNPGAISKSGGGVTVTGTNFDATSSVLLGTPVIGGVEFCTVPVNGSPAQTTVQIAVTVPATLSVGCYIEDAAGNRTTTGATGFSLSPPTASGAGQYLVRVQHGTDVASGDFAALLVTNSSFKPFNGGVAKSTMVTARGQAGATIAFDDLGQPFLYVAGGSTDGNDALTSVEVAPVGLFGDLGGNCTSSGCAFRVLDRTPLPGPRAGLSLVQRSIGGVGTSYLYAIAGRNAAGAPQNTVYRAQVLRSADAPTMRQITTGAGAGPGAGAFYYKVSALGVSADVPESLPSDEESASLNATQAQPTIRWGCVAGATGYRIYRTQAAGAVSNTEVVLKDVTPACSGPGAGTMTATDDGTAAPGTARPLPRGALGKWTSAGTLTTSRFDQQARTLPNDHQDILVMGGCTATSGPGCSASTNVVEILTFTSSATVDPTISVIGSGLTARDRFGVGIATSGTANVSAGKTFVLVFGGETNGTEISGSSSTVQVADIVAETTPTALAPFTFTSPGGPNNVGVGGWADIVANQAFSLQTKTSNQSLITSSGSLGAGPFSSTSSFGISFSNTGGVAYAVGGNRFLCGEQLFRAFIYVVGGFPNGTPSGVPAAYAAPTNTVELFEY